MATASDLPEVVDAEHPDPAPAKREDANVAPWVHVTPSGVEYGGDRPTGSTAGLLKSFWRACVVGVQLRSTLWIMVQKEFKSRYRAQALGLFWSLAYPLLMMVNVTLAFVYILGIKIPNFPIFYLIGAIFWHWFSNATLSATGTFVEHGGLVKRTTIPRFLLPIARVLSSFINFLMEWVLVLAFYLFFPDAFNFTYRIVALPLLVLILLVMLVGVSLMVAALNVQYRDVYYLVTSLLTIGFWLSPILYETSMAPERMRFLLRLNPLTGVMEGARSVIMRGQWPDPAALVPGVITALIVFVMGCLMFRKYNLTLADHI